MSSNSIAYLVDYACFECMAEFLGEAVHGRERDPWTHRTRFAILIQ
jgi:hypothetical protein